MTRKSRWVLGVGVAVALVAGFGLGLGRGEPVGERAPEIDVPLLSGGTVSLSGLRGQVVLVNFWATWCPPCRVEMPGFQRVYQTRADDGFTILGLSTDRLPDDQIRWFLQQNGIGYMVGRGTAHAARAFGGASTLPTSFLIDARGRIRRTVVGAYEQDDLLADVDALLGEAGREPTGEVARAPSPNMDWMELREVGQALGEPDAPVTVVEFSDYGCSYCSRFTRETFPQLYAEFIDTGRVRWVHMPFVLGKFGNSEAAALASACAAEQGRAVFWSVHMTLFRHQPEWRSGDPAAHFRRYVEEAGGDGSAFSGCYERGVPGERLSRAERIATAARVSATPTFFIDGQRLQGAAPLEEFRRVLEEAGRR
ncbi:MAG: thioredoxin domain-containing protein [Longimicrobiales bacterium]|nr:thioredoxin domain-containing protein [Longimicrobiales bacterium]